MYPPLVAYVMDAPDRRPLLAHRETLGLRVGHHDTGWPVTSVFAACLPAWNRPLGWAAVLFLLCFFEPVRYGFWLGQTTALIFPLVVGAVVLQRRQRMLAAGLAVAVAVFIKLTPVVLVAAWLWRGPRRAALWFAVFLALLWTASLATMGVASNAQYRRESPRSAGSISSRSTTRAS